MAKYLVIASYSPEGIRGVLDKGGTARRKATESAAAALGGRIESFHFGFGADDVYVVCEMPDNETAAALSMRVAATGLVRTRTIPLLTAEEVDKAAMVEVKYQPPGS